MNHDDFEPILQPWMERQARTAPHGLLLRVMTEVETMSQEATLRSRLSMSAITGMALAGAALLAITLAVTMFVANLLGPPTGGPTASPSPAATTGARTDGTDPRADATGEAPDILAIHTTEAADATYTVEVVLAAPMAPGARLAVWYETNGAHPADPLTGTYWLEGCELWQMNGRISVDSTGDVWAPTGSWQPSPIVDGRTVSFDLPLERLNNAWVKDQLAIVVVSTDGQGGEDRLPDESGSCYPLLYRNPSDISVADGDPVGDLFGDGPPDFIGVTTSLVDDQVVFLFEFFGDAFVPGNDRLWVDIIENADVLASGGCDGWSPDYRIETQNPEHPTFGFSPHLVDLGHGLDPSAVAGTPLEYSVMESSLTILVPYDLIGAPEVLHFTTGTYAPGGPTDRIPNWDGTGPLTPCVDVTLVAAAQTASPTAIPTVSPSGGSDGGWPIGLVGGAVLVGVGLGTWWVAHQRTRARTIGDPRKEGVT